MALACLLIQFSFNFVPGTLRLLKPRLCLPDDISSGFRFTMDLFKRSIETVKLGFRSCYLVTGSSKLVV